MRQIAITILVGLCTILMAASEGHALPSCCQGGNNQAAFGPPGYNPAGTPGSPVGQMQAQDYRGIPRQTVREVQPAGTVRYQAGNGNRVPAEARTAYGTRPATPCGGCSPYQAAVGRDFRPAAAGCSGAGEYRGCAAVAAPQGCCGAAVYGKSQVQPGGPSCCGSPARAPQPAAQSAWNRPVNVVPASAAPATAFTWGTRPAQAGSFEKPSYFPGYRTWQTPW